MKGTGSGAREGGRDEEEAKRRGERKRGEGKEANVQRSAFHSLSFITYAYMLTHYS